jgi:hypothetical protein
MYILDLITNSRKQLLLHVYHALQDMYTCMRMFVCTLDAIFLVWHKFPCVRVDVCIALTYLHTCTRRHTPTYIHLHTHTRSLTRAYTPTHTRTRTCTNTTHTHTHIYKSYASLLQSQNSKNKIHVFWLGHMYLRKVALTMYVCRYASLLIKVHVS